MKRRSRGDGRVTQRAARVWWLCQSLECLAPSACGGNRLTPVLRPSRLGGLDDAVEMFHQSGKLKEYTRQLPNVAKAWVEGLRGAPESRVEGR